MLQHLGIHPGDRITVDKLPNGRVVVQAAQPSGQISDAFGMLKRDGRPALSIDDMDRIVTQGWAGKA